MTRLQVRFNSLVIAFSALAVPGVGNKTVKREALLTLLVVDNIHAFDCAWQVRQTIVFELKTCIGGS
jgi:hypothetical protein